MMWMKEFWCNMAHGGGDVKRDPQGRINWQCGKCGRWSDPVASDDEKELIDRDIAKFKRETDE